MQNQIDEFNNVIIKVGQEATKMKRFISDLSNMLSNENMQDSEKINKINKIKLIYDNYHCIVSAGLFPNKSEEKQ